MKSQPSIRRLFPILLKAYGSRGWWPVTGKAGTPGFDPRGYHPGDYRTPRTAQERFEIILGAVLTQNTAWTNAEGALRQLRAAGVRTPRALLGLSTSELARLIRPSGCYNQKERKLRGLVPLFLPAGALAGTRPPVREALLAVWGVGEETADSILLFAFGKPVFVVDAYTRRLLLRLGLITGAATYAEIQRIFSGSLPRDPELYNEYHALIVEHAKVRCRNRPLCEGCPVSFCPSNAGGRRSGLRSGRSHLKSGID